MYVYILGGFLGSGKTTLLMKIATQFGKENKKVAIIVNEAGEIGVDGATLKAGGYDAIELPNGCICCTLSGTLQNALRNIAKDIDPDIIIIEPTGLALPHKVKELVHFAMIEEDATYIIGVADIQRFDDLIKKKTEFFKRQMHGSEFILINKCDISNPESISKAKAWLNAEFPEKEVIPVSTKTGENMERVFELMKQ